MWDYHPKVQRRFKLFGFYFLSMIYACEPQASSVGSQDDDMGVYETSTALDMSVSVDFMNRKTQISLVEGDRWVIADPTIDPFIHHLGVDRIACSRSSYGEEYSGVEVNTGRCDYITLTQNLPHQIKVGDHLQVIAWHNPLYIPKISEAHIALSLGTYTLWQKDIILPSDAQHWDEEFISPIHAEIDTPIFVHIRNHGNNTWTFYDLQLYQN